ncbi:MAG: ribose 1,5-bisphosphate isomerase [Thermoprotei archaeon]|nr:MAG: ribose 1,5-bisphosphate isomerase [Thermoprotei archaeon]RLF00933.1 MAG: ribose 1,5-bisphosphate isomerase [Thermoprotei archaeon]
MNYKLPKEVLEIAEGIRSMKIRGAGRIARAAVKALKIAALGYRGSNVKDFYDYMMYASKLLLATRPTAVSLPNAVAYVMSRLSRNIEAFSLNEAVDSVVKWSDEFIEYSLKATQLIGEIGEGRIKSGNIVLTHCNSSAALSVIITAHRKGKDIRVYACETRPKFQGKITAKTLAKEGIDVTLIPDSAVRFFMKDVDLVIVGADTVAANGAVVNKIGTSMIALAAHEARVRVFVAAETYKFSPATVIGELVTIEERPPTEVVDKDFLRRYPGIKVRNPAFDVTPPEYIDAIITEKGVISPHAAILVLREEFAWTLEERMKKLKLTLNYEIE